MAMTEQEAKTKWCPWARAHARGVAINRNEFEMGSSFCMCLASGCMVWEWAPQAAKDIAPKNAKEATRRFDASILRDDPGNPDGTPRYELCEATGFCGLTANSNE